MLDFSNEKTRTFIDQPITYGLDSKIEQETVINVLKQSTYLIDDIFAFWQVEDKEAFRVKDILRNQKVSKIS
jgi:hypothetical protein